MSSRRGAKAQRRKKYRARAKIVFSQRCREVKA
jgi:hypothetical protein